MTKELEYQRKKNLITLWVKIVISLSFMVVGTWIWGAIGIILDFMGIALFMFALKQYRIKQSDLMSRRISEVLEDGKNG